ncbi:hypothetical protein ACFFX0_08940 [Citricoccus parietis]|uniref:Uncharacterized protein n=1 Tax=Citricoccus parietis TaxID=592307 RepID=A0ABV5FXB5_9MICC
MAPCSWAIFCSRLMAATSSRARSRGSSSASIQGVASSVTVSLLDQRMLSAPA